MVKSSVSCCCVCGSRLFSDPVTCNNDCCQAALRRSHGCANIEYLSWPLSFDCDIAVGAVQQAVSIVHQLLDKVCPLTVSSRCSSRCYPITLCNTQSTDCFNNRCIATYIGSARQAHMIHTWSHDISSHSTRVTWYLSQLLVVRWQVQPACWRIFAAKLALHHSWWVGLPLAVVNTKTDKNILVLKIK